MLQTRNTAELLQKFSRSLCYTRALDMRARWGKDNSVQETTNLTNSLEENIKTMMQQQTKQYIEHKKASIYRVPTRLRRVEPETYTPHFISIGPYHHGSPDLQGSEGLKVLSLNHLMSSGSPNGNELNKLVAALNKIEHQALDHYSEDVKLSKDEFVKMMLLDGCFIIDLFRDLHKQGFARSTLLPKRWMLPVVRRDLITLENQLPMIVLKILFDKTRPESIQEPSIEELALRFFDPLMPRARHILTHSIESSTEASSEEDQGCHFKHLLDLFHSSLSMGKVKRCREPHMYRSVSEMKVAGIKVRALGDSQPLDLRFERGTLRIPPLQVDSHTGSFFQNIVAYEQCHPDCKPDMTTYLFFLVKLINSSSDVGILHYEGVIQHSLGSNKQVADLVNELCKEVEHDRDNSYLCHLVEDINSYCDKSWIKAKARLKHEYFSNLWVGISTIAGFLLLYLTLLQTTCGVISGTKTPNEVGWWGILNSFLAHPVPFLKKLYDYAASTASDIISNPSVGLGDIVGSANCMAGDFVDPTSLMREILGTIQRTEPQIAPKNSPDDNR